MMPGILQARSVAALARAKLRRVSPAVRAAARARDAFYREVWQEAAGRCGAVCRDLGDSIIELEWQGARHYVFRNYTPLDDPVTLRVAGHKGICLEKLGAAGLPVPRHCRFTLEDLHRADVFLQSVAGPCVVKPASGSSAGAGVVTGVRDRRQLTAAAVATSGFGSALMMEEQVEGDNIRLLYLDGELIDAVLRRPPAVTGNGRSTIRQLIAEQNRQRLEQGFRLAQAQLAIDTDVHRTLQAQGLSLKSIPDQGRTVEVKTVVNDNSTLENNAVHDRIGPALAEEGRRAAGAIGVRLAGVDVITPDPLRGLGDAGGVVLEVNTTPGFYLHYHRQGAPVRIAEPVLRKIFTRSVS